MRISRQVEACCQPKLILLAALAFLKDYSALLLLVDGIKSPAQLKRKYIMAENQLPHYHAFLSHNSRDKVSVEPLAVMLKEKDLNPFLDKWNLVPGEPIEDALIEVLENSDSAVIFVGPGGEGPWQSEEMRDILKRARVSIFLFKTLLVNLLECFKTIFDTTVVSGILRLALSIKIQRAMGGALMNHLTGIPSAKFGATNAKDPTAKDCMRQCICLSI